MRLVLLIAFVILTSACETTPPKIEYEFATFSPVEAEPTTPSKLPELSPLKCYPSDDDCQVAGYDEVEDIDRYERFKILADGNTEVAQANAEALELMLEREEAILAAGKAQEEMTNLYAELLAYEKQERAREKWYYRALLVVIAGAGVYASGN